MFLKKALFSEGPDLARYVGDREAFIRVQREDLERKVFALRQIYDDLLDDVEALGASSEAVEEFIEIEVRPSVGLSTTSHPTEFLRIVEQFGR